jgi:hypothetical protein
LRLSSRPRKRAVRFPAMARATVGNVTATKGRGSNGEALNGARREGCAPPRSLDSGNRGFYTRLHLVKEVCA